MIPFDRRVRHRRFALVVACALVCVTWAAGADPPKKIFRLSEGDAAVTLKQFSQQAGEQIVYPIDLERGVQTNSVRGEFTPRDALNRMVANTGLVAVQDEKTGAFTVGRKPRDPPPPDPAPPPIRSDPKAKTQTSADPSQPMNPTKKKPLITALTGWFAVALTPAFGQAPGTAPQPASNDEVLQLNAFITTGSVTPQTRLATAQAITTIDRQKLDDLAPRSTAEMLKIFPGVYTESTGGEAFNNISIRGSGYNSFHVLQEDGLPVFSQNNLRHAISDEFVRVSTFTADVEGVRGGSANIFATNAPLGLFNFISREGSPTLQGEISFTTSDYGTFRPEFWVSGPAGTNTTYALGGYYRVDDGARPPGYVANRGGQVMGNIKHTLDSGRGYIKLSFKRFEDRNLFDLTIPLINASDPRSVPFGPRIQEDPTFASTDIRRLIVPGTRLGTINYDLADGIRPQFTYVGTEMEIKMGENIKLQNRNRYTDADRSIDYTFTSLATPWQTVANAQAAIDPAQFAAARDASGNYQFRLTYPGQNNAIAAANPTAAAALDNGFGNRRSWQHSSGAITNLQNDLRVLATLNDNNTTATAGLYYSYLTVDQYQQYPQLIVDVTPSYRRVDITFLNATTGAVIGPGTLNGLSALSTNYRNDVSDEREVSPYVAFEHKIGRLNLDAGYRRNIVKLSTTQEDAVSVNANTAATGSNPAFQNARVGNGNFISRSASLSTDAWSVGANYTFNRRFATFARVSRGGRFSSATDYAEDVHASRVLSPTRISTQFEAGIKFGTSRLALFLTAFHIKTKDIFATAVTINPLTGALGPTVITTQAQETNGIEFESVWTPLRGLSLGLNGTVQDPKWTSSNLQAQVLFNGTRIAFSENGLVPQRIPKYAGIASASYRFPETQLGTFSINGSYQYTGKRFADFANSEPTPLHAYGEAVAGITFTTMRRFTVHLSVNNVFNQQALSEGDPRTGAVIVDPTASTFNARPILPRTITGTVSYRF